MKNIYKFLGLILVLALVFSVVGCSSDSEENSTTSGTKSIVMHAITQRSSSTSETYKYVNAYACSNSDISSVGDVYFTTNENDHYLMGLQTGYNVGEHYYYGTSGKDHGEIRDPFAESAQRQWATGAIEAEEPLNGDYRSKIGDVDKTYEFNQSTYLTEINENDVSTGSGGGVLDVTNGDTITIKNQDGSGYRYFVMIYNNVVSSTQCENIWASADIREIDWVNVKDTEDFYVNYTKAAVDGKVTFEVPGGVLTPEQEMIVMIFAVRSNTVNSDTNGDFYTLVAAQSRLRILFNAQ